MSKKIEIPIDNYLLSKIQKPIREKSDILIILLETINIFLIGGMPETGNCHGKIIINIDKMSRIVYELENKIFSVGMPFTFEISESGYIIKHNDIILNSKIISDLISMIVDLKENEDINYLFDTIIDSEEIYRIFKYLFMSEYGYIRYDYDEEHYNGKKHPKSHIDINCIQNNQYKLGLEYKIGADDFIDLLNLNTDCYFLKKL